MHAGPACSPTDPVNPNSNSNLTRFMTSSPDPGFVPRKEFVSTSTRQFSSFALLSFSSNNVIRATNFDHNVFNELKARLHSVIGLRAFRENAEHKLGEIILLGKPWSNARSLSTEIVLVQVFTVVLRFGYNFVSQIDYGREPNDRLTLVFSQPHARTTVDHEGKLYPSQSGMIPFGLSFTSATSLRVVCSPLTGTPAILQSIRGAWPKGVKSEKKLGEHCYEFKLKGYSWFQEDTFNDDAPRHILTILSSLDKYSFDLITSLSLSSGRSRTKDFWIFASHPDASTDQNIRSLSLVNLGSPLKPSEFEPIEDGFGNASGGSEGSNTAAHSTEDLTTPERPVNGPFHVKSSGSSSSLSANYRTRGGHLRVSSDITGLAVPRDILHPKPLKPLVSPIPLPPPASLAFKYIPEPEPSPVGRQPPTHSLVSLPKDAEDEPHPPTNPDFDPVIDVVSISGDHDNLSPVTDPPVSPMSPLLVPNVFRTLTESEGLRTSAASHFSEKSFEVPITWAPRNGDGDRDGHLANPPSEDEPEKNLPSAKDVPVPTETPDVNDPVLPGGWVNTPKTDVIEDPILNEEQDSSSYTDSSNPLNGTLQRNLDLLKEPTGNPIISSSPRIVQPGLHGNDAFERARPKSVTAIVGTVPSPESSLEGKDTVKAGTGSWVVVSHREPSTDQHVDNELSSPINAVPSNRSVDNVDNVLPNDKAVKPTTLIPSAAAVTFVDQTPTAKGSLKGDDTLRKRKSSVVSRLLGQSGQSHRKEESGSDNQTSLASGEEKRNRLKSKKLLPVRSRK